MKESIALIGPISGVGRNTLHSRLDGEFTIKELRSEADYYLLNDVRYIVLRTLTIGEQTIRRSPQLKLIQRWGVGYDTVDIKTAGECGVQVAVAFGINAIPVAEYAVMLILSVLRNVVSNHQNVVSGSWQDTRLFERSYVINGKMVGLIGLGAIGRHVAGIVRGMGARTSYYDVNRLSVEQENTLGISYCQLDELVSEADVLSLHAPITPQTEGMIDKRVFDLMKPTAVIINTARGGIINEKDLYESLKTGRILGAGLDVFDNEPIDPDNPLLQLKNVVLSAHSAGNTADNNVSLANRCADNILRVRNGEPLPSNDLVNRQYIMQEREMR